MTGRDHIICGVAAYVAVWAIAPGALEAPDLVASVVGGAGAVLGSLLPDADSEDSILGRYVHLPFEHRTWTHAVWFPILITVLAGVFGGLLGALLWGTAVGYWMHLAMDSLGRAGVCWLYPLNGYKRYDSGAFIARGHRLKLYRNGEASELVVVGLVLVLVALLLWAAPTIREGLAAITGAYDAVRGLPVVL